MMNTKEWQGIWVVAEQINGNLSSVSCELLGKAQELKSQNKFKPTITAVILGHEVKNLAQELANHGAEEIIVAESPDLKYFQNESYALVLEEMIIEYKPAVVLIGATGIGSDLAPTLGAKLRTGVAAHCIDLRMNDEGNLVSVVPAFGGKVLGDILCPNHRPQIATVKAGVMDTICSTGNQRGVIVDYDPNPALMKDKGRVKALGIHQEKIKGIPLEKAEVVVAGGWGIGCKEDWGLLVELADLLGGAVGCTRPALDEGWAEGEHQMIGTS
ncbi:MAG: electron transfer flavoprotein subunit alpha/FixB family protein, partial [Christensenellales bacterium]